MGGPDRTESDRRRQERIENPPAHGPERAAPVIGHLRRRHARQPWPGTARTRHPAHPLPTRPAPPTSGQAPRRQGVRLRPPAPMATQARNPPPHRPQGHRVRESRCPRRCVLHIISHVTPPLNKRGNVSRDALGRRRAHRCVQVAVEEILEDSTGGPVIRRPPSFPDGQVVTHARRLSHRNDQTTSTSEGTKRSDVLALPTAPERASATTSSSSGRVPRKAFRTAGVWRRALAGLAVRHARLADPRT